MKRVCLESIIVLLVSGCRIIQLDTSHAGLSFTPKATYDSLWLFTPIVKFADYSETFDDIAKRELNSFFNDKLIVKNDLRSTSLIEILNLKEVDSYFKSLRKTPVTYWIVYTINIDKIDPFEDIYLTKKNADPALLGYLRIFEVSSGKQVYLQTITAIPDNSDEFNEIYIPYDEKYYQKLLEKTLRILKKHIEK